MSLWNEFSNVSHLPASTRREIEEFCDSVFKFWEQIPKLKDELVKAQKYELAQHVRELEKSVLGSFKEFVWGKYRVALDCKKVISNFFFLKMDDLKVRCSNVMRN